MAPSLDPPPDYALLFQSREDSRAACKHGRRGYRVRSEETWAAARGDYERGVSAEKVCAAFDIGLSALRQRARREGWRRRDQADPEPMVEALPPEPEAAPSDEDLHDLAWRSMAQALRWGRVYEARAWMRLTAELKARIDAAAQAAAYRQRMAALEAERLVRAAAGEPEPNVFQALSTTLEQVRAIARAAGTAGAACAWDEAEDDDLLDDDLWDEGSPDDDLYQDERGPEPPPAPLAPEGPQGRSGTRPAERSDATGPDAPLRGGWDDRAGEAGGGGGREDHGEGGLHRLHSIEEPPSQPASPSPAASLTTRPRRRRASPKGAASKGAVGKGAAGPPPSDAPG